MIKFTFRQFRITSLLVLFFYILTSQALAKYYSRSWQDTLQVIIYPINGDQSDQSQATINALSESRFASIPFFIKQQAQNYGVLLEQPIEIKLASQIKKPPAMPALNANILKIMFWSLKMRWWAWVEDHYSKEKDIRLFVEYYATETDDSQVSVGLEKGLMALVKNYSSPHFIERNNFIIAHEMLHTLGATDKYNPSTLMPAYPQGYANPKLPINQKQTQCEIMGGRIPLSVDLAVMPSALNNCLIGMTTAKEIGWLK
ncbi:MAG: hypothetical protein KAG28_05085 [Cocleimonas sp.]|nr:hypothetical protein [Cocleimonas sp.]